MTLRGLRGASQLLRATNATRGVSPLDGPSALLLILLEQPALRRLGLVLIGIGILGWMSNPAALSRGWSDPSWLLGIALDPSRWKDLLRTPLDIGVYREGAAAALNGANLYDLSFNANGTWLPFTYPPFAALLFTPLTAMSVQVGGLLLAVLSMACLWHCVLIVCRGLTRALPGAIPFGPQALPGLATLITAIGLLTEPVAQTIGLGQINIILMWLVINDLLNRRNPVSRRLPRGVLTGVATAIKLTPAVFALYLVLTALSGKPLMRRRRGVLRLAGAGAATAARSLGGFFLGFGAATAGAWAMLPAASQTYWTQTLSDPSRIGNLAWPGNQSVRGALSRFLGDGAASPWWYFAVGTLLAIAVIIMPRLIQQGFHTVAVLSNAGIALMASPVSWSHHWVWLLPVLGMVATAAIKATSRLLTTGLFLASLLILITAMGNAHWLAARAGGDSHTWGLARHLVSDSYVLLAAGIFLVMLLWSIRGWRRY